MRLRLLLLPLVLLRLLLIKPLLLLRHQCMQPLGRDRCRSSKRLLSHGGCRLLQRRRPAAGSGTCCLQRCRHLSCQQLRAVDCLLRLWLRLRARVPQLFLCTCNRQGSKKIGRSRAAGCRGLRLLL